jgi:retron-type reverse transcriptase
MSTDEGGEARADWRARMREVGKAAFIREEMERLGFWSPEEETADPAIAEALAELRVRSGELRELRAELARLDARLGEVRDLPKLLADIRRKRIERVRAARDERRRQREQETEAHRLQDQEWRRQTLPFLGRGVSGGLRYEGGDPARVASLSLPRLATAGDVAAAIGIRLPELAWLTYHRGAATVDHYHRFTIPKRTGGTRVISSPKRRLRVAQAWLLKAVLEPIPVHAAATAFRPGRSIVQNAAGHAGKAVVLRIDLQDFFPSITFPRVKGLFQSFDYNEGIATLLALLATEAPRVAVTVAGHESRVTSPNGLPVGGDPRLMTRDPRRLFVAVGSRRLPQGACTSPAISNLLCRKLDARLSGAAQSHGFAYTRYADDLVFSSADREASVGIILDFIRQIIEEEGFGIQEAKTRVMRAHQRQAVTGLVVNQAAHVSRDDVRRFRAFLHHCETEGLPAMSERLGKSALAYAAGYLAFLHMVSPQHAARIREAHPWLSDGGRHARR